MRSEAVLLGVLVVAVVVLAAIQVRHRRRVARQRGAVLGAAAALFESAEITQDGIGFPSLRGQWCGRAVRLSLVVDTLAMRELPSLWLLVDLMRPLPVRTPVDITLRPRSTDIVSAGLTFDHEHRPPANWPEDIRVATPSPALPPLEEIAELLPLLAQDSTKEVLIAPGGIRIAHQLARGALSHYRVVRRPVFSFSVEPARVSTLLESAESLADRIEELGAPVHAVGA